MNLREVVCEVLERADEEWGCTGVVVIVEVEGGEETVHSLMYVGGVLVRDGDWKAGEGKILVGLEL